MREREYTTWLVAVGLTVAGLLLFGRSLAHPFHFDDGLILADSNVTNAARWAHFLNPFHLRQLTYFTFYLNHLATGANPAGFHAVNVSLHILNALLLLFLLRRVMDAWPAGIAACLFLLHPVQTEPVLYVYQRSILLACFFSLLALHAVARKRHWLAVILFVCAFESKESALAVPLALALLNVERDNKWRRWGIGGAAAGGVLALSVLAYRNESTVGLRATAVTTPLTYLASQLRVFYTYLRLLWWPYPQSIEYDFSATQGWLILTAEALGILGLAALGIWAMRRKEWQIPGAAVLAFLILLAPTSSLIPSTDSAFEHRLYLPMLAFSTLAAWLLARANQRNFLAGTALVVFALLSLRRTEIWASDVALWQDAVAQAPGKARAWYNLGSAQVATDPANARVSLRRAIDLQPIFPDAYVSMGVTEHNTHKYQQAILYFQEAVRQAGDHWPAWYNMGNSWYALGDSDRAIVAFERALQFNPDYWPAHYNIAVAHMSASRYEAAIPHLRTVLDWDPSADDARKLLIDSLAATGNQKEATLERQKLTTASTKGGK